MKSKIKKSFAKELIAEYGQQTLRDKKATKSSFEDAAWVSVFVAQGCGFIKESECNKFHKAIVNYAKNI